MLVAAHPVEAREGCAIVFAAAAVATVEHEGIVVPLHDPALVGRGLIPLPFDVQTIFPMDKHFYSRRIHATGTWTDWPHWTCWELLYFPHLRQNIL